MVERISSKKNIIFNFIVASGILITAIALVITTGKKEFWYDEMATLGFMKTGVSFKEMLHYYLTIEASNLPLYQIIVRAFYELLPATAFYVLLPSMIMTILGEFLLVRLTDKAFGRVAAYIVLLLSFFSTTFVNRMGLLLRAYSLMFLASIFTFTMIYKLCKSDKVSDYVLFTLVLLLLVYSHYFGCLLFGMLGLGTFLLALIKKVSWKQLLPYFIAGLLFLPWFLLAMKTRVTGVDDFWIAPPTVKNVIETIGYLLGGNIIATFLWGLAFAFCLVMIIKSKSFFSFETLVVMIPMVIIATIFIYSHVGGSLYENRYFIVIAPYLLMTIGIFFQKIFELIHNKKLAVVVYVLSGIILLATFVLMVQRCVKDMNFQYDIYGGPARYIINQGDLEDEDVLLITRDYTDVDRITSMGWYDYFFERRGIKAAHVEFKDSGGGKQTELIESYGDIINKVYIIHPIINLKPIL